MSDRHPWTGPSIPIGGGASVVLNPGTGPVPGATSANARANLTQFVDDLGLEVTISRVIRIRDGRYWFSLRRGRRHCMVEMPGLPVEQVRYLRQPGQDPWDYPRLYVDRSSWLWRFALDAARRALAEPSPE